MNDIWMHPFTWGLTLGLFVCACVIYVGSSKYFHLKGVLKTHREDLKKLRSHLETQMSITARGNESLQQELDTLKKQNETLRINLDSLSRKPGRAEVRTLHVYDKAIHMLCEHAPGFASHWERALQQAEREIGEAESGIKKLLNKVFRPALMRPAPPRETEPAYETEEDAAGTQESSSADDYPDPFAEEPPVDVEVEGGSKGAGKSSTADRKNPAV